jgi:hypothetical protein
MKRERGVESCKQQQQVEAKQKILSVVTSRWNMQKIHGVEMTGQRWMDVGWWVTWLVMRSYILNGISHV